MTLNHQQTLCTLCIMLYYNTVNINIYLLFVMIFIDYDIQIIMFLYLMSNDHRTTSLNNNDVFVNDIYNNIHIINYSYLMI